MSAPDPAADLDLEVIRRAQVHMRERHGYTIRRQDVYRAQNEVGHTLTVETKR